MSRCAALLLVCVLTVPLFAQHSIPASLAGPPTCPGVRRPAHPVSPESIAAEQERGAQLEHAIPSAETVENFALDRARLARYGECTGPEGCYWTDLDVQFRRAEDALTEGLAHRRPGQKAAIVLDIDETSLSNYCEMKREDFGYIAPLYDAWTVSPASAVAIPGALRLFQQAKAAGVAVFFITGRPGTSEVGAEPASSDQTAATERNLQAAGFEGWMGLRLRNGAERKLGTIEYKQHERQLLLDAGYDILLSVGDQWSDLLGAPQADRSVKLPNPFYFIP